MGKSLNDIALRCEHHSPIGDEDVSNLRHAEREYDWELISESQLRLRQSRALLDRTARFFSADSKRDRAGET